MDNNSPASALANIMKYANQFIKQVQSGEGLNVPEDKKQEFQEKMKEHGTEKMIEELKEKMNEFKDLSKKINNGKVN